MFTGYLTSLNPYFGATIGRVTNRTFPTDFLFNGQHVSLSKNVGGVHLHGGYRGFDKVTALSHKLTFVTKATYQSINVVKYTFETRFRYSV
jgi:galactose mutarotase-like enzyme